MTLKNVKMNEGVLTFIGGFRSGSTLLINLLGLHPSVSVWYETKCICEPLRWMKILNGTSTAEFEANLTVPRRIVGFTVEAVAERMRLDMEETSARISGSRASGKAGHERYPIGADYVGYPLHDAILCLERWRDEANSQIYEDIASATGRLIGRLAEIHLAGRQNVSLINKTPEIPRFGAELRECLGACRVINLIRDGREVAASAAGLQWGGVYQMGEFWAELIQQSRVAAAMDPLNYQEVRYEELVTRPPLILDQIFRFLDVDLLGTELVGEYEKRSETRITAEVRACDPAYRASLEQLPVVACALLEELGYVASGTKSPPKQINRNGNFTMPEGEQYPLLQILSRFLR